MAQIQVLGGGKMGEALLGGLLASGWTSASEVVVVEPSPERREAILAAFPGVAVAEQPHSDIDAIIAVKPAIVAEVAAQVGAVVRDGACRVLSIAAGVTTAAIEAHLPAGSVVVRAMPNTPALVGAGAAAIAGGAAAKAADLDWAASILGSVGIVEVVTEADLDAVTGLSGSGPAYVFLLAEALIAAGEAVGLAASTSAALAKQTLLGAAMLLDQSTDSPATLRENVTSPQGTTAAGLAVFAEHDFMGLVASAVEAARDRSIELGAD